VAKTAWNCARDVSSVVGQEEVTAAFRNNKEKERHALVSLLRGAQSPTRHYYDAGQAKEGRKEARCSPSLV
jgi:hypothetical protein